MFVLPIIFLILVGLFSWSFYKHQASLWNGFLALMTLFSLAGNFVFFSIYSNSKLLHTIFLVTFIITVVGIIIIYTFHAVIFIWNGIIVWIRESHSLANLLTLILGIFMLLYPLINFLLFHKLIPKPYNSILELICNLSIFYLISLFVIFSISVWICNFYRPKNYKDFIIVLGSGLLNGNQVSPLLAARIQRAIDVYQQQAAEGHRPLIICSGGQGGDETTPEGVAMRDYVIAQGVDANDVVAEDKSRNTIENFAFSKQIVDQRQLDHNSGIFVSNNYHIYRASSYAHQAGMNIYGLGAKTSFFFLPNAIIREFIAILMRHKLANLMIVLAFILIAVIPHL
ncbi:YdcF family protein [Apilactobacillus apinorum]|uniref:YdcF family protein n=1 Tax=Apilactobacillus apinorum TaxID=1218495 RepID=UPI0006B513A9|nr:YdcF family protein [Apilactobacillus apinorum]KOY68259.1 Integral membrane protein [Apilactobacillus apinorum]CAI2691980.1 Integral membrane protein [Apilactobacillus apinorum]